MVVALLGFSTLGLVIAHLPVVQRLVWTKITDAVTSATGLRLEADKVRFRLMPGRAEIEGLIVGSGSATPLSVGRLEVRFRWRKVLREPRSIDVVKLEGLNVDLTNVELPTHEAEPPRAGDPGLWQALEIGKLTVTDGRLVAAAQGVGFDIDDLTIAGALGGGSAAVTIDAGLLTLERDGRTLAAGSMAVAIRAAESGVVVDRAVIEGDRLRLAAAGELTVTAAPTGRGTIHGEADLPVMVTWWDPALGDRLAPQGKLTVDGSVAYDAENGLLVDLAQSGGPVTVAGFALEELEAEHGRGSGRARIRVNHQSWVEVSAKRGDPITVNAEVNEFAVGPLLALADHPMTRTLPPRMTIGGHIEASLRLPLNLADVEAGGSVVVRWPEGHLEMDGSGGGRDWRLRRMEFEIPGASGTGQGSVTASTVAADLQVEVADPRRATEFSSRWLPAVDGLALGGGPASIRLGASGRVDSPVVVVAMEWSRPRLGEISADEIRATASATLDEIGWTVDVVPDPTALLRAEGTTAVPSMTTVGRWEVGVPSIADVASAAHLVPTGATGGIEGSGEFSWSTDSWSVDGSVSSSHLGLGPQALNGASGRFHVGPDGASVTEFEGRLGQARVGVEGSITPLTVDGVIDATVRVEQLVLEDLGLGEAAVGTLSADAQITGEVSKPELVAELGWASERYQAVASPLHVRLSLAEGVLTAFAATWHTAAGPIHAEASVPLGELPRPEWLWAEAPAGPIRASLTGIGLRSGPVVAAFGGDPLPGEAAGDVVVDLSWDLSDPASRLALLEIDNLSITGEQMDLKSESTVRARLRDGRVEVEPFVLTGPRSHIEGGGVYDLSSGRLVGAADLDLSATIVEMLPIGIQANGPIRVQVSVDGPLAAPNATVVVNHEGGSIVMRDPAVAITDLRLRVEVDDGVVWIQDGEAGLNKGHVLMGGGWDPVSGQGVVLELEEVKVLLETSIVTSWSGAIAIEPDPDHTAKVVGELGLDAGVWERPFDLKTAFFGSEDEFTDEEDPANDIALDLQVAGYGGVRVDNNLGRFDASWGTLEVGGTVGRPELIGTVRLAPGGTVNLPGQTVVIRRATLDFTGNPDTDPVMEIVPEQLSVNFARTGDGGSQLDTRTLAAETLARGAGSVLGLENTTLQPAEIALETQTDASSAFTAGRRLTRNVAIFLTTDLSDVQSQTTMLQLWNLRGLPGLAIQGYTKTGEGEQGANLIERYRWGGTAADDDRPVIQTIKFEGEWPVGTRRLRRTTGLGKGEPYEPFLLFAAGLRLETALAERGYPRARVSGEAVGDPALPALVFSVDPGPRQEIRFTGDRIPSNVQRTATGLYREPPLEQSSLRDMRRTVIRHLFGEGFPEAAVTVERVGDAIIVDNQQGPRVALLGPVVEGLSNEESAGLRDQIGNQLMLAEMARDRQWAGRVVERGLQLEGFPAAHLEDLWLTDGDDGSRWVHLRIMPGTRQRLAQIELSGEDPLALTADGIPGIEVGMALDRRRIGQALSRVRSSYRAAGYSQVEISSRFEGDGNDGTSLVVNLEPGSQRKVRRVGVDGLRHIRETVILNGLTIEPGEVLLPSDLDTSAVRTAFFAPVERANVHTRDVGVNSADVTLEVTEKPRWTVEAGAGWSSERGASLQFGFRDDGLLGRGAGLSLRGLSDESQQQATLYASLPPLPGGRWSVVANTLWFQGDSLENPEGLKQEQRGVGVEATYRLTPAISARGYGRGLWTETDVKDPQDPLADFFPVVTQETILGSQLIWDRLDNPFDPRKGSYAAIDLSHNAPSLGSDLNDIRLVLTGSIVVEPKSNWTWAQSLRLGGLEALAGTSPSSNRKFFAGGQATVRGFDLNTIGPVIPAEDGFIAEGGAALFVLNEELRIPVIANIRAAVFADVGQVWKTWDDATWDFSVGAGIGLRLATPVGPLWADVAWPVANPNISTPGAKYYFGLGTNF